MNMAKVKTKEEKTDVILCGEIEGKLLKSCDYVRITFNKNKKRPWRVELLKCKRCREMFVHAIKLDALKAALTWLGDNHGD